jgi:predicted dehydrogenase/threonine dehydrogenase-like Zn-dependent dehydrogenase
MFHGETSVKQLFYHRGKGLQVLEVPTPHCKDHGALVDFRCSSISSGTETETIERGVLRTVQERPDVLRKMSVMVTKEGLSRTLDLVRDKLDQLVPMGYSAAGVVAEVGQGVHDLSVGDRVACGGVGYANHAECGFVPRNLIVRMPEGVSHQEGAFVSLGAIALQGVRRAALKLGERVFVLGLGLVGQLTVQVLRASGVRAIGADLMPERVELAKSLGMDSGFVFDQNDPQKAVSDFTAGRGVDAIIICASSKNDGLINRILPLSKDRGTIVIVGDVPLTLDRTLFYAKELNLLISRSYGPGRYDVGYEEKGKDYPFEYVRWTENRNMEEFISLMAERKIDVNPLITGCYPLDRATEAYAALRENETKTLAVLFEYGHEETGKKDRRKAVIETTGLEKGDVLISVVGTGGMVRNVHLPNLKKIPSFRINGLMSVSGANNPNLAKRYGARYVTSEYDEILGDPALDCVLIASRHHLHAPMVIEAIEQGKHVFVEKPLALTYEECNRIAETWKRKPVKLMVGFNRRFSPLIRRAKDMVAEDSAPKIVSYRVNATQLPPDNWMNSLDEGGGLLLGEGCHFFDLFRFLLDEEPTEIFASALSGDDNSSAPFANAIVTVHFMGGSIASLVYTTKGNSRLPKERLEIFSGGTAIVVDDFRSMDVFGHRTFHKRYRHPQKGLYEEMLAFLNYLHEDDSSVPTVDDGIRATQCALKAMESIRLGTGVSFSGES